MLKNVSNKLKDVKFILASTSQPRKEMFQREGIQNVETLDSGFVEDLEKSSFEYPSQYVKATSNGKIQCAVAKVEGKYKDCVVVSCDTVVVHNNKIYEKPVDLQDQQNMLRTFSGNCVDVISWVNMCFLKVFYWKSYNIVL